jgi:hypothetical protein
MFGSLVVCLPSQFMGGKLVLSHRGIVEKLDWGRAIQAQPIPNQLHWAAFFGDVNHQIEQVWGGARVTLSYLLRRGLGTRLSCSSANENLAPRVQEAWRALLDDKTFLPKGGTLGYPCSHLYHQDACLQQNRISITRESASMLKGRDHLTAATALQAGLKVVFQPYMFENCADETWQLARFPTPDESSRLGDQVDSTDLENALPIRANSTEGADFGVTWLEPPPSSDEASWRPGADDDLALPAAAHLHSCEYCPWGYFGNEASYVDLYTYAALHIAIPAFGRGSRKSIKPSKPVPARLEGKTRKRKPS